MEFRRWSTGDVPVRMARDYWVELMRERIFRAPVDLPDDENIQASLSQATCGQLRMSWIDSHVRRAQLSADAAERINPNGDIQLSVLRGAEWAVTLDGTEFRLAPNDILLANLQSGFDMKRGGRGRTTSIFISRAWLRTWIPAADLDRPTVLRADSGWSSVLASFIQQLTPERMAVCLQDQENLLDTQMGSLLSLVHHERTLAGAAALQATSLARVARACIKQRFTRFGLTAAEVAIELGVSERTLHRAFASENASFFEQLNSERMAAAKRMLCDPRFGRVSVADIGSRIGFADASHFIRRFKAAYGDTPAAMRREWLRSDKARYRSSTPTGDCAHADAAD